MVTLCLDGYDDSNIPRSQPADSTADDLVASLDAAVAFHSCGEVLDLALAAVRQRWGPPRRLRLGVQRHRAHARFIEATEIAVAIRQRLHDIEKIDLVLGQEIVQVVALILDERCARARAAADEADDRLERRRR